MVSLNPQGKTGCGVLPEIWAAKCPGTLIRRFENVFYPRTTMKWDWKYGPKKRQKRSKTPISRESLPYEKRVFEAIGHASSKSWVTDSRIRYS